jgi:hypothetical protein
MFLNRQHARGIGAVEHAPGEKKDAGVSPPTWKFFFLNSTNVCKLEFHPTAQQIILI